MGFGNNKVKTTVTDPLSGYKNWAADQKQSQYNQIQPATGSLLGYYNNNFGKTDFSGQMPQLSQDVNKAVQGDVEGTGGPFTSLKQNLLGSFDTGAKKYTLDPMREQLIKEGIYSSGGGLGALSDAGNNLAQQRATLGSQVDVNELNFANQLGQQQFQNNQLLGFQNPLTALGAAQSIQPPNVQDIFTNTTQDNSGSIFGQLLGKLGSTAIGGLVGGPAGAAAGATIGGNGGGSSAIANPSSAGLLGQMGGQGNNIQSILAQLQNQQYGYNPYAYS